MNNTYKSVNLHYASSFHITHMYIHIYILHPKTCYITYILHPIPSRTIYILHPYTFLYPYSVGPTPSYISTPSCTPIPLFHPPTPLINNVPSTPLYPYTTRLHHPSIMYRLHHTSTPIHPPTPPIYNVPTTPPVNTNTPAYTSTSAYTTHKYYNAYIIYLHSYTPTSYYTFSSIMYRLHHTPIPI